jgi:hypothetical protein
MLIWNLLGLTITAMIGENWEANFFQYSKRILYFSCLKTIIGRGEVFCTLTPFFLD